MGNIILDSYTQFPASGVCSNMDTTGLLAYYTMNEACGTIVNQSLSGDSVGTAGDGTNSGATYGACGIIGDAMSFDVEGDKITFGSTLSTFNEPISSTAKYSFNLWLKPTSHNNQDVFLDQSDAKSTLKGIATDFRGSCGAVRFVVYDPGVSGAAIVDSGTTTFTLTSGSWNMLTITYDYSLCSANLKMYLNAGTAETYNKAQCGLDNDPSGNLTLGDAYLANDNAYDGDADELSVW